ncbi:helix-turn-helix domain-containing protein [Actinobacillus delphinicola]|uniref:Helix-turn-helix domain n=1 Tax=Actinobacillus delphinicola TaxID=51161 RepID=A0A448TUY8_9PAST|nr:helix-turn-helix transcriptional regulator [Actinobacillus delphinicola]VEJ09740.1 Helix-turn-helix domain [Actinobacillus delphinicola]
MALTEFGKAVRKARIDLSDTLLAMAQALDVTPGFLSGMETGRKKIPMEWAYKIQAYFKQKNLFIENLPELAQVSNESIPVDNLPLPQKMMLASFAKSAMTDEQIQRFEKLLEEINKPI